jgi:ComF family protein
MQNKSLIATASAWMLDLVFPVLCLECDKEGSYLCNKCDYRLSTAAKEQVCAVCSEPSPFGKTHSACGDGPLHGFIHVLRYKEPIAKRLIQALKYQSVRDLAETAGKLIFRETVNQALERYFSDFIIVPIPLHPKRLKWRGYNQAELIAKEVAIHLGVSCRPELLIKTQHSRAQATLNKKGRQINLSGAFEAGSVIGLNIILIDDVATTRSTLMEAAHTFKKAQAASVWVLTLAYEE